MNAAGVQETRSPNAAVLLVEDEEELRRATSKLLRRSGFVVIEAADGAAAAEVFRTRQGEIGVVMMDLGLPVLSGSDLFAALKQLRPGLRIVVATGSSRTTVIDTLRGEQPWAVVQKPYQIGNLVDVLRASLAP